MAFPNDDQSKVTSLNEVTSLTTKVPRHKVILTPQEGRYYSVTTWTEQIISNDFESTTYYSTKPLKYVGKYIGGRIEGWGKHMKEWGHFMNEQGAVVVVTYNEELTTAFYEHTFRQKV